MRILWLAKRFQSGKDVYADSFGRYFHLPRALAQRGLSIHLALLSYRPSRRQKRLEENLTLETLPPGYGSLLKVGARFDPDYIIGSSDPWCCYLAAKLSRALRVDYHLDLHDDYESYLQARVPGLLRRFRDSLTDAKRISVAQENLIGRFGLARAFTVPNGSDPALFYRRKRREVPNATGPLVGYFGALHPNRGIETLIASWPRVRESLPTAQLWLAGKKHPRFRLRLHDGITYLGHLPQTEIPSLLSMSDLAIVMLQSNLFGRSAWPYKLTEAEACQTPVLGPRVGIFAERYPERCFDSSDSQDIADKIIQTLRAPGVPPRASQTWQSLSEVWLEGFRA